MKFFQQIPKLALQTKDKVKQKIEQLRKEDSKYLVGDNLNRDQILKGLESKSSQNVLGSLKRLLALSILGKSISKYVNKIIAQLANPNIEIKRICYFLLAEISQENPDCDELLMCISPLLKQITSNIPSVIKGDTLKTLCSLTIQEMKPMLINTLQKLHVDKNPYVKKIAALNLVQFYNSRDVDKEEVETLYRFLLRDVSYLKGSVLHLSRQIQDNGDSLEFVHYYFRKVCKEMHTYTVFDIVHTLQMMNKYGVIYLKEEQRRIDIAYKPNEDKKLKSSIRKVHPDVQLLMTACNRLMYSTHPSVILELAHIAVDFPQPEFINKISKALMRFVNINSDSKYVILLAIEQLAIKYPQYFKTNFRRLFVTQQEKVYCQVKKIQILYHVVDDLNVGHILDELNYQIRSPSFDVSIAAIDCIKKIAIKQSKFFGKCIKSLTTLLKTASTVLVEGIIKALSELIQEDIQIYYPIISYIFEFFLSIRNPLIKERIIVQISQCCQEIPSICINYYRILLLSYLKEHDIVKLQIGNLGLKLLCVFDQNNELFPKLVRLFKYNLNLGVNDKSFKVRDGMRFIKSITLRKEVKDINSFDIETLKTNITNLNEEKRIDFSLAYVKQVFTQTEQQINITTQVKDVHSLEDNASYSLGLLTDDGYRIGTLSSILKIKFEGYSSTFEIKPNSIQNESTDDKRSQADTEDKLQREQQQLEKLQRQNEKAEAASQEESQAKIASNNPENKLANAKKQVQNELLNHYQDTLKKTLSDFFEED